MRVPFFLSLTILLSAAHPVLSTTTLKDGIGEDLEHKQSAQTIPSFLASDETNTTKTEQSIETTSPTLPMNDSKEEESPKEKALRVLKNVKLASTALKKKKRIRQEKADKLSAGSTFQTIQDEEGKQTIQVQASPSQGATETDKIILAGIFANALEQFIENSQYLLPKTLLNLGAHIQGHTLMLDQLSSARPYVAAYNLPTFDQGVEKIEKRQAALLILQTKVFELYTLNVDCLAPGKEIPEDIFRKSEKIVQELTDLSNALGEI